MFFINLLYVICAEVKERPTFEKYKTSLQYKGKAKLDLKSHKEGRLYRTVLRNGVKKGANFAGQYAVIENGCGTNCQLNWIVNLKTGKIIAQLQTTRSVKFRIDSSLIIIEPLLEYILEEYKNESKDIIPATVSCVPYVSYAIIKGDKLHYIYKEKVMDMLNANNFSADQILR